MANFVRIHVGMYTKGVCLLKRFSFVFFESCFESVVRCWFLKIGKCFVFASLIQVAKRLSTHKFLKRLLLCFNPFNKFIPSLYLDRKSVV